MESDLVDVRRPFLEDAARTLLGAVDEPAGARPGFAFRALAPSTHDGVAAAVDGGQSVVADLGACGVVAVRAGFTVRRPGDRFDDRTTFDAVHVVVRRNAHGQWSQWMRPYDAAGELEPPALAGPQWLRAWCDAERSLAEAAAARQALRELESGDLLLWDGSLAAEDAAPSVLAKVHADARSRNVSLAGIAKDTSVSLGGLLPFTLELEEAAQRAQAPARFWVDLTDAVQAPTGLFVYGVRFDPRASVYRVDVAAAAGQSPEESLERLAALANDVAFPGYPYPLARIHQRVHFADDEAADLKRRLESIVSERRGSLFGTRFFGRGRDVLALGA